MFTVCFFAGHIQIFHVDWPGKHWSQWRWISSRCLDCRQGSIKIFCKITQICELWCLFFSFKNKYNKVLSIKNFTPSFSPKQMVGWEVQPWKSRQTSYSETHLNVDWPLDDSLSHTGFMSDGVENQKLHVGWKSEINISNESSWWAYITSTKPVLKELDISIKSTTVSLSIGISHC